jgi:hypothetical protein
MKNLFYTIAKAIVANHEKKNQEVAKKSEEEHNRIVEAKKLHDKFIDGFKTKYLGEVTDEFKKNSEPEFKVGDLAVTHWYGIGSHWDGSVKSLQSHTPFRGPIEVEITGVHLDTEELAESINIANEKGLFDDLDGEVDYPEFKSILEKRGAPSLHWAYTLKVPGDENKYWGYTWRENKLLDPKSDEARWSKKAFKNELESQRLREERDELEEKIKNQIEKANHIRVKCPV